MKTKFIKDIAAGESFDTIFLLEEVGKKPTKAGGQYWTLKLRDKTGDASGKIWDESAWPMAAADTPKGGDYVKVRCDASTYKGKIDLTIRMIRRLDPERDAEGFSYEDFVPVGPQDRFKLIEFMRQNYLLKINHPGIRAACLAVFDDPAMHMALRDAPAAESIHQPYIGGLIEHVRNLYCLVEEIGRLYQLESDSYDLLYAACLFHDIGKTRELKWKTGIGYTDEGRLIGHVGIGLEILDRFRPIYWDGIQKDVVEASDGLAIAPTAPTEGCNNGAGLEGSAGSTLEPMATPATYHRFTPWPASLARYRRAAVAGSVAVSSFGHDR